jgi:hypothetical protein
MNKVKGCDWCENRSIVIGITNPDKEERTACSAHTADLYRWAWPGGDETVICTEVLEVNGSLRLQLKLLYKLYKADIISIPGAWRLLMNKSVGEIT